MSRGRLQRKEFEQDEIEFAKKFHITKSNQDLLLLDIDTDEQMARFEAMLPKVKEHYPLFEKLRYTSKSGKGTHIVLQLEEPIKDVVKRMALQAILGSDPVRELLSLARIDNGIEEPSRLFRPKEQ